jgi:hypothetical protein
MNGRVAGSTAWAVGKGSMGAVAVGGGRSVFVELGIKDGRMISGVRVGAFTEAAVGVLTSMEGWNGVGVAVASGAEVIKMIGRTTWLASGLGVAHADKMIKMGKINAKRRDDFMNG